MSDLLTSLRLLLNVDGAQGVTDLEKNIQSLGSNISKLGSAFDDLGKQLSLKVTAPLTIFGALAVDNFGQAERASAKLRTAISGAGQSIGETFDQIKASSEQLSKTSIFDSSSILEASANLANFGTLTGKTFQRAQAVVVDFASKTGTDVVSASEQLGRALADPANAVGVLHRAGILLSDSQQQLIKNFVELGQNSKAQDVILKQLEITTRGVGQEIANTGTGPILQLKNQFHDLTVEVGGLLVKAFQPTIVKAEELIRAFENLSDSNKKSLVSFGIFAAAIGPALVAISSLVSSIVALVTNGRLIVTVLTGVGALITGTLYAGVQNLALAFGESGVAAYTFLQGLSAVAVSLGTFIVVAGASALAVKKLFDFANHQGLGDAQDFVTKTAAFHQKFADGLVADSLNIKKQRDTDNAQIIQKTAERIQKEADLESQLAKLNLENQQKLGIFDSSEVEKSLQDSFAKIKNLAKTLGSTDKANSVIDLNVQLSLNEANVRAVTERIKEIEDDLAREKADIERRLTGDASIDAINDSIARHGPALAAAKKELLDIKNLTPELTNNVKNTAAGINAIVPQLGLFARNAKQVLTDASSGISTGFADAFLAVQDGTKSAAQAFSDFARQVLLDIERIIIQTLLLKAIQAGINSLFPTPASAASTSAPGVATGGFVVGGKIQRFDTGGHVKGPGSGTSDSILARLSNGEFVLRAAAVKSLGLENLRALNSLNFSKFMMPRFALGGLVAGLASASNYVPQIPRYANGGLIGPSPSAAVAPNVQIVNNDTPKQTAGAQIDPKTGVVTIVLQDLKNNGQISQAFAKTFGVKR